MFVAASDGQLAKTYRLNYVTLRSNGPSPWGSDMAIELFVLSDKKLNSMGEWQTAIDNEEFPIRLANDRQIETLKGFLPVVLRRVKTGFECGHQPVEVFMREGSDVDFGRGWQHMLTFRWGGDLNQLQSAWMAAAAYARATNGVVFDDEEAKIHSAADACEVVRDIEDSLPAAQALLSQLKKP